MMTTVTIRRTQRDSKRKIVVVVVSFVYHYLHFA